jgi:hypothetical protein
MRLKLLLVLLVAVRLNAGPPDPVPRPLSAAEEAAAAALAHYLGGGADAVLNDLGTSSPLRALGPEVARGEIEARLGPLNGAKWRLDSVTPSAAEHSAIFSVAFPSGIDDSVRFDMEREGEAWRVAGIHSSAEPVIRPVLLKPLPEGVPGNHVPPELGDHRLPPALALPALALSIAGIACSRRWRIASRFVLVCSGLLVIAATVIAIDPEIFVRAAVRPALHAAATPSPLAADTVIRLAPLLPLRKALASGDASTLRIDTIPKGPVRDVAMLWTVQMLLQQSHIDDAKLILNRFGHPSNVPLAELLRARIAWEKSNEIEAVLAYEHAIDLGSGRDTLWLEAAEALSIIGFDERGEGYLSRAAEVGSHSPSVFYGMSALAVMNDDTVRAGHLFQTAWQMCPLERGELFHMTPLWSVLAQAGVQKLLQLSHAAEPSFASHAAARPMVIAPGAKSSVSGDYLRIALGGGELDVPGGAAIAPAGPIVTDAGTLRREGEQVALADYEVLRRDVRSGEALLQPAVRARCLTAAAALASRNRWGDVILLTEPFSPDDERVPLVLTILRGEAMSRLGRRDSLRQLIAGVLHNPALKRKKDPETMMEIGELLAAADEYEAASRVLQRPRVIEIPGVAQRISQLNLEQKLASAYSALPTEHFDIRVPPGFPEARGKKIAGILEAELHRLRGSWFPNDTGKRITVDVLSWRDFTGYTGSEYIAGLYTNKIILPIANVDTFRPEIVAIMTHELAHALLAEATDNLAPRWFHEALASRLEMTDSSQNAFQFYRDEHLLTVALLDAVADGSPDPELIVETYQIGETTLRFIEARYGKGAIEKMIAAFRGGLDTDAAVRAATGTSVADLDRLARAWGASQPSVFPNVVVRYDNPPTGPGVTSVRH